MFPEYRDLITKLKTTDHHFTRLFDKHNELDQKIKNMRRISLLVRTRKSRPLKRKNCTSRMSCTPSSKRQVPELGCLGSSAHQSWRSDHPVSVA